MFNTVVSLIVTLYAIYYFIGGHIEVELVRTLWLEKPYAIEVTKWNLNRRKHPWSNSGTVIFTFKFRSKPADSLKLLNERRS